MDEQNTQNELISNPGGKEFWILITGSELVALSETIQLFVPSPWKKIG